jgi:hypothetical protein
VSAARCTGSCTGSGTPDVAGCAIPTANPTAYACPKGACSDISSPAAPCTASGVACWCAGDADCARGRCVAWVGCPAGACSGSGATDAFHCAL